MKGSDMTSLRGRQVLGLWTTVLRMLKKEGMWNAKAFILPIVNNPRVFKNIKSAQAVFTRLINDMQNKAAALDRQAKSQAATAMDYEYLGHLNDIAYP